MIKLWSLLICVFSCLTSVAAVAAEDFEIVAEAEDFCNSYFENNKRDSLLPICELSRLDSIVKSFDSLQKSEMVSSFPRDDRYFVAGRRLTPVIVGLADISGLRGVYATDGNGRYKFKRSEIPALIKWYNQNKDSINLPIFNVYIAAAQFIGSRTDYLWENVALTDGDASNRSTYIRLRDIGLDNDLMKPLPGEAQVFIDSIIKIDRWKALYEDMIQYQYVESIYARCKIWFENHRPDVGKRGE